MSLNDWCFTIAKFGIVAIVSTPLAAHATPEPVQDVIFEAQVDDSNDEMVPTNIGYQELYASWEDVTNSSTQTSPLDLPASVPSILPVQENVRITSNFGMRRRRAHQGIDLAAPRGTPVYATADGIVTRSKWLRGYGRFIEIDHGAGIETRYAHLNAREVESGSRVRLGDLIGYVGSSGRSTGPHLHYEVRLDGVAVDPRTVNMEVKRFADSRLISEAEGGRGGE